MKLAVPSGERLRFSPLLLLDKVQPAAAAAYGLRLLRSQYVGPLIRLRRASDSAELDFSADLITTRLDLDAIAAWAGGDSFVVTWYDQIGTQDATQDTAGAQPQFVAAKNGRSAINFTTTHALVNNSFVATQPNEIAFVFASANDGFLSDAEASGQLTRQTVRVKSGDTVLQVSADNVVNGTTPVTDDVTHYVGVQWDGASSVVRLDGVDEITADLGTSGLDGFTLGNNFAVVTGLEGHLFETLFFDAILSSGDRNTIELDQAHHYGLPIFALDKIATPPAACYSLRRLRVAYNGPLVRLRRSSDSQEKDFWAVPGDPVGTLNVTEILIWLAGDTGFVVTWYDQSGFGHDVVQATAGNQPKLDSSTALLSILYEESINITQHLQTASSAALASQPCEVIALVSQKAVQTVTGHAWSSRDGASRMDGQMLSTGLASIYSGGGSAPGVVDHRGAGFFVYGGMYDVLNQSRTENWEDGVNVAFVTTGSNVPKGFTIGNQANLIRALNGNIAEVFLFDSDIDTDRAALVDDLTNRIP